MGQTPTTMLRILFIAATFCLLQNQVSALTCCKDESCIVTQNCTTSSMCYKNTTPDGATVLERGCEENLPKNSEWCEISVCVNVTHPIEHYGPVKVGTQICCCEGDKCNRGKVENKTLEVIDDDTDREIEIEIEINIQNGSNFQYGSVFLTLTMTVLSRFV